jgi:hypothetical protein
MFNTVAGGNDNGYNNTHYYHRRVGPIVRRWRRLLLDKTTIVVTSRIILTEKFHDILNCIQRKEKHHAGKYLQGY